ncbi:MAG: FG-GAP repeat domain-containing protein [Candidatus Woesearchaeota archaeon]
MKKSQITIFIILGIIVLIIGIMYFAALTSSQQVSDSTYLRLQSLSSEYSYISYCIQKSLAESIYYTGISDINNSLDYFVNKCIDEIFPLYNFNVTNYNSTFTNLTIESNTQEIFGNVSFDLRIQYDNVERTESFLIPLEFYFVSSLQVNTDSNGFVVNDFQLGSSDSFSRILIPSGTQILLDGIPLIDPNLSITLLVNQYDYYNPGNNIYMFGPSGISFSNPVEIVFFADDIINHYMEIGATAELIWIDNTSYELIPLNYNYEHGFFTAHVNHFSFAQLLINYNNAAWKRTSCGLGGSVNLDYPLRFDQDWVIELTGNFNRGTSSRVIQSGTKNHLYDGLDWFAWGNNFAMRLYRGYESRTHQDQIRLAGPSPGSISSQPPKDHWVQAPIWNRLRSGTNTLRAEYHHSNRKFMVFLNNQKVIDVHIRLPPRLPPPITNLHCIGFQGQIRYTNEGIIPGPIDLSRGNVDLPIEYFIANLDGISNSFGFYISNACTEGGRFYHKQLTSSNPVDIYNNLLRNSNIGNYIHWGGRSSNHGNYQFFKGDFDGDGIDDLGVYWYYLDDPSQKGRFFIIYSSDGLDLPDHIRNSLVSTQVSGFNHATLGTGETATHGTVVVADFDGDGIDDFGLYNDNNGHWEIFMSNTSEVQTFSFGYHNTFPVPADYNGNGKADLAIYDVNRGKWYIESISGETIKSGYEFGFKGGIPVVGDYNGDGKADLAIYGLGTGLWFIETISGEVLFWAHSWGLPNGIPIAGSLSSTGKSTLNIVYDGHWHVKEYSGTHNIGNIVILDELFVKPQSVATIQCPLTNNYLQTLDQYSISLSNIPISSIPGSTTYGTAGSTSSTTYSSSTSTATTSSSLNIAPYPWSGLRHNPHNGRIGASCTAGEVPSGYSVLFNEVIIDATAAQIANFRDDLGIYTNTCRCVGCNKCMTSDTYSNRADFCNVTTPSNICTSFC